MAIQCREMVQVAEVVAEWHDPVRVHVEIGCSAVGPGEPVSAAAFLARYAVAVDVNLC